MSEPTSGPAENRAYFASVVGAAGEEDFGQAQVAIAAALVAMGVDVVSRPPAGVSLSLSPEAAALSIRPRVVLVPALEPTVAWRGVAERFAVVDERAGAALVARGVPVERVVVAGWPVPRPVRDAAPLDRAELRARFDLSSTGRVVVVDTRLLDEGALASVLLSLSLVDDLEPLFDAPDETTALVLRDRCPRLGIRARRFGAVAEAPLLYRAADAVVGRPRPALVALAKTMGLAILALGGDDEPDAEGVAGRGIGRRASSPSVIAAELQILLQPARLHAARAASASMARPDAVAACARLVADVLRRRTAILDEPEPRPPSAATAAGPLEEVGVDPEEYRRIAAERRSLQLLREQAKQEAKQEIDDRLAALKSRMKPQP